MVFTIGDPSLIFAAFPPFSQLLSAWNCDDRHAIDKNPPYSTLFTVNLAQAIFGISLTLGLNVMADEAAPTSNQIILHDAKGHIVETPASPEAPLTVPEGVGLVSLEQAIAWQNGPGVIFVDARGKNAYIKDHIPGAVRLGQRTFEQDYPLVEGQLRGSAKIVIYCTSRQCDDSVIVANKLTTLGYRNLFLFEGGWAEWWKYHRKKQP